MPIRTLVLFLCIAVLPFTVRAGEKLTLAALNVAGAGVMESVAPSGDAEDRVPPEVRDDWFIQICVYLIIIMAYTIYYLLVTPE